MSINYYVLDTETTGLKAGWHEINQISMIRVNDGFQKSFNIAVEHPERADSVALNIQGITRADLKKGTSVQDAVQQLTIFLEEDGLNPESRCVIGHNVAFDRRFCQAMWEQKRKQFPADLWLCTKKFYKNYVNKVGPDLIMKKQAEIQPGENKVKYGQDLCLTGAGLKPKVGAHSAIIDCQNCLTLFQFLMNENLNHVRVIEPKPHRINSVEPEIFDF
jgi:DNA polymerase III epsilon subunit-like protein